MWEVTCLGVKNQEAVAQTLLLLRTLFGRFEALAR